MPETMEAWVVVAQENGQAVPREVCRMEATANRLAGKVDGTVQKVTLVQRGPAWFGPVQIVEPNERDKYQSVRAERSEQMTEIIGKVQSVLSQEEIQMLRQEFS